MHHANNVYVILAFFQGHWVPMVKVRNNNNILYDWKIDTWYQIKKKNANDLCNVILKSNDPNRMEWIKRIR